MERVSPKSHAHGSPLCQEAAGSGVVGPGSDLSEEPDPGRKLGRHVQDLLDRRADLQGVSKLADLISDATRWAA